MKRVFLLTILCLILVAVCTNVQAAAKAGEATVQVGSTTTISLATTYQNTLRQSTGISARWSTSSSNVSITSQTNTSCTIKGVTAGTAQVNYYCSYYIDGYYRTMDFYYTVTISSSSSGSSSLTISPSSITLYEGETYSVTAYQPGYVGGVYFTSSNSSIASVSTSSNSGYYTYGTVTAVSEGTTYIYAKSASGASSTACTVTVKSNVVKPTSIYLPGSKSIEEGEYAYITATVSPSNATYSLTWTSSNTNVATVNSSGRVYGKSPGTARITAKVDGYNLSDYCDVTVKAKQVTATSLSVEGPETYTIGESYQLSPVYTPNNATVAFQYTSDNTDVATVSSTGLLTIMGEGKAIVTVTETISNLMTTLTIEVAETPENIEPTDISTLDDAIYAEASEGLKGGDGTLTICLKNAQATNAYSFDLILPEGVTLAKDGEGEYVYTLSNRHNGHSATVNYHEATGVYSFAVLSLSSKEVKGNDGTIWTLKLNVADDVAVGDYAVKVQNAKYSLTSGSTSVILPETVSVLTVEDYVKGDANGDGVVDIADAVCIVNHVVGKETPAFVAKAADANGDGVVDIADAVRIVNLVVGKIDALARQLDPQ